MPLVSDMDLPEHLIAKRLKSPRLAGPVTWRPFLGAWGLRTLPIAFDAAGGI